MTELGSEVIVPHGVLERFCSAALSSRGVREDVREHVVRSLTETSLRGVDSHGLELLPHYVRALDSGRINPVPAYRFDETSPSTARLDADHTFGHAAGAEAMSRAVDLARASGTGAVAVFNSTHFGAAAYFAFIAARANMIGMSFTHADSLMLSYGGSRPFFGTNPICFAAPIEGEDPFCLDMATTRVSWNKVRRHREAGLRLPPGWACDDRGEPTSEPASAAALLPIGDYKGFGLAMIVEILCSLLTGAPNGRDILRMYADPIDQKRYLGHFFIAIDVARFEDVAIFKRRLRALIDAVRSEPPKSGDTPVMVPGDPEKRKLSRRLLEGIPISRAIFEEYRAIGGAIGFAWSGIA